MADILGRFWSKVREAGPDECWEWRSTRDDYGRFNILPGHRAIGTHRFSWILANGQDIPPGLLVTHSCDNKRCVNPSHLSLGTYASNAREAVERGLTDMTKAWSGIRRREQCQRGHPMTPENYYEYDDGGRRCRTCHSLRSKLYRRGKTMSNNPNSHTQLWAD